MSALRIFKLTWTRRQGGIYTASHPKGVLKIVWTPYGKTGKTWQGYINGERVPLAFSSRLWHVQEDLERRVGA